MLSTPIEINLMELGFNFKLAVDFSSKPPLSLKDGTQASICPSVISSVRPCIHNFKPEYLIDQPTDRYQISSAALLG